MISTNPVTHTACSHCGDECRQDAVESNGKFFCCEGCKLVNELLEENNLCTYYQLTERPGNKPVGTNNSNRFAWLDDETVNHRMLLFSEGKTGVVSFSIPKIHCTSCIWLLEHLHQIQKGILNVRVNFPEKAITVIFNREEISLRIIVELLHRIGYEPDLHLDDLRKKSDRKIDRQQVFKIGVAGFCFGNIMMLSFPEYLSGDSSIEPSLKHFFSYLNLLLSLPVFFYSASGYFINSWKAARNKYFSIDLPIALGLTTMLLRSSYEIIYGVGPGYLDSMTGLVFFLLLGRFFESLTHKSMSFERDYQSYFPVAVAVKRNGEETYTPVSKINPGDKIVIHSEEMVPADGLLLRGDAYIDYSFVTGESEPVAKNVGELIFAGGKQKGPSVEIQVQKTVAQSYLTQLWNHESFRKEKHQGLSTLADVISKYFTIAIILIAAATAAYWLPTDFHRGIIACTAILIIACPCALAITIPFTFGNIMRILGRNNFYLKNSAIIEVLSKINTIVFDKTGTLTHQGSHEIRWNGPMLTGHQWRLIKSMASQSLHPLSKMLASSINTDTLKTNTFIEVPGSGIEGMVDETVIQMGSPSFTRAEDSVLESVNTSCIYVRINDDYLGYFQVDQKVREGLEKEVKTLSANFETYLVSGDNESGGRVIEKVFTEKNHLFFNQSPAEKLELIEKLQQQSKKVMMIGDGLNDAGALQQSDAGIAVTDDLHQFSPACDVIMSGSEFKRFHLFLQYCKSGISIIWFTFAISLLYNAVGIYFAVQGNLSPLVAAILMPLSSISVILITTLATRWKAKQLGL